MIILINTIMVAIYIHTRLSLPNNLICCETYVHTSYMLVVDNMMVVDDMVVDMGGEVDNTTDDEAQHQWSP